MSCDKIVFHISKSKKSGGALSQNKIRMLYFYQLRSQIKYVYFDTGYFCPDEILAQSQFDSQFEFPLIR
jgi:hypothetical protein